MTDVITDTDSADVALLISVGRQLVRLGGRENETLSGCLSDTDRRAWQDVERLVEHRTCIVPSSWTPPDSSRITLTPAGRVLFAALRDRLARYRPSELLWSRRPSEASLMIQNVSENFHRFETLSGGRNATNH